MRRSLVAVALVAAALGGVPVAAHTATPRVCERGEVLKRLEAFSNAFTAGDVPRLMRLFAPEPQFKWYSSGVPGERFRAEASRRFTLRAYFRGRAAANDTLRVSRLQNYGVGDGFGHFAVRFERSADDFRNGEPFDLQAKGAVWCGPGTAARGKFAVFSLGGPDS